VSHVTRRSAPLLALATILVAAPAAAQETKPAWEFGAHGILLMNGFYNDAEVNNADVPSQATPPGGTLPQEVLGAAVRQTRLVGTGDLTGFAGGTLHAELDVDFFGGQFGSGRLNPILRVRRAVGEMKWDKVSILIGQESPVIADVNPRSLATLGVPGFAAAGNLWLWIPQIRGGFDLNGGEGMRIGIDAALMAPTGDTNPTAGVGTPTASERSGRPMLESRVRARWGDGGEVGLGGHLGWVATPGGDLAESNAIVASAIVPLGSKLEFRGEWFTGQAIASLGGGGIGQNLDASNEPVQTTGGWASLTLIPNERWEIGGGYGFDDPDEAVADTGLVTVFRFKNTQYNARVQWRAAPVVFAFEYRHLATTYSAGIGEVTASHFNLAMGLEF
jgi:hypothetical protein